MAIVCKILFCASMVYLVQTRLIPATGVDLSFAATGKSKLERFINVRKQSWNKLITGIREVQALTNVNDGL